MLLREQLKWVKYLVEKAEGEIENWRNQVVAQYGYGESINL